jgi:hypothetical protein
MKQTESRDSTDFKPEKLIIGAERISEEFFDGELSPDQVYRLPKDGWPIFKVRGKLAARPASMRAEMARREAETAKRRKAS